MYLETKDIIDRPLSEVYPLVRDNLILVVPYLPDIDKVEVLQHKHSGTSQTHVVNHWYAKVEIPAVAKKFISEELFSWKDTASWNNDEHFVEYTLESFLAKDLYEAKGKNFFKAIGENSTELTLTCEITIHPEKVPGVPKFLVKKVLPQVESLIKAALKPNLSGLGKGLKQYFEQNS